MRQAASASRRYSKMGWVFFGVLLATLSEAEASSASAAAADATAVGAAAPRPNILYFYVDDMGWGAIGPNGQAAREAAGLPRVLTPNLDRLAAEGVNFVRSYGATVCSPARSSQQTGFHQGHTFADRNDPDNAKKAMRADDLLIGDVLARAGYATGYWGKWGYGGSKDHENPEIVNVQTLPTSHGYQHVVAELHHVRAHTFFQPTLWTAPAAPGALGGIELQPNSMAAYVRNPGYPNTPALQDHAEYPETAYCDDVYALAALDFVRAQARRYRDSGQPFLGLLAVQIPHAPFGEIAQLPEWDKAYRNDRHFQTLSEQSRQWAAMVTRIDAHFGNLLKALEDPDGDGDDSDSVAADTLVIFQSDNGGPRHPANDEFDANGGLRGHKGQIYEGGIRIPTLMRWPGRITADSALRAGTSSKRVVDVSDMLPTFCELAGVPAPVGIDGVSLASTLMGDGHQRVREFVIHEAGGNSSIIRGKYKLVRSKRAFELYDLDKDRAETRDIASEHPRLVDDLTELLLGERVTEPKGFANTYHRWIGEDGAATSDPDNWSDYVYENAGVTYMTETGGPQVSWIALMENAGARPSTALADADLEFLGLEIRGGKAAQTLRLASGVTLTGRNEVRISANGCLALNGGDVSSLRWLETLPGGTLEGPGCVHAALYNQGAVTVPGDSAEAMLEVVGDYVELGNARLVVTLGQEGNARLRIQGDSDLAGTLTIVLGPDCRPAPGDSFTILTARQVRGTFANPHNQVVADNGARFQVDYTDTAVSLTVR